MMSLNRAMVGAVALMLFATNAADARPPAASIILADLGFALGEQVSIDDGAVISRDLPRSRDSELAAVVAVLIPAPLERVEAALLASRRSGWTSLSVDGGDWRGGEFSRAADQTLARLDQAAAVNQLNLSAGELSALRSGPSPDAAYREILVERMQAYADRGLDGVAPYQRTNGQSISPAQELRLAAEASSAFLAKHFPTFAQALMQPPGAAPAIIENHYAWTQATVDGLPAIVLAHDAVDRSGEYCVVSHRQFFVGHTYNSLHGITVLVPARDGTLAVGFKRTFTDRVAGPVNGFQRDGGPQMLREALAAEMAALRSRATGR